MREMQEASERRKKKKMERKNFFESNLTNTALIVGCAFVRMFLHLVQSWLQEEGGGESAGFLLRQQTQRKEHPREDPWAILGSPLPGGEAIKPYPESRKKGTGRKESSKGFQWNERDFLCKF